MDPATIGMIGQGVGVIADQLGISQQMSNQNKMMNKQKQNQMELNKQMQDIQQQNWDYTNYENQRKHMESAGLNVGMMYGQGGGGGTTMGGGSGGSAQGGNVDKSQMGMMLQQGAMMQSQMALNEANADKAKAEADNIRGAGTENLQAETGKKLNETEGIKLDNALKSNNLETYTNTAKEILNKTQLENNKLVSENKITKVEADNAVKNMQLDMATKGLNNILTQARTKETNQLTEESKQRILQKWEEVQQNWNRLDLEGKKIEVEKFKANLQSEYPGAWNTIGKMMNDIIGMGQPEGNVELHRRIK